MQLGSDIGDVPKSVDLNAVDVDWNRRAVETLTVAWSVSVTACWEWGIARVVCDDPSRRATSWETEEGVVVACADAATQASKGQENEEVIEIHDGLIEYCVELLKVVLLCVF